MSNSNSPGSIVREGYFESISPPTEPPRLQDEAQNGKNGKSEMRFFIFVTFICCCGLAIVLLTIFLWRKYTRVGGAANCDTYIQEEQQIQHQGQPQLNTNAMIATSYSDYQAGGQPSQKSQNSSASKAPCLNCRLIQMGSAISYGDNRCPQCGEQVS